MKYAEMNINQKINLKGLLFCEEFRRPYGISDSEKSFFLHTMLKKIDNDFRQSVDIFLHLISQ